MTILEWTAMINSIGVLLAGAAALWSVIVSKRGVEVSTQNQAAISSVQFKQDTNKAEIKQEIQSVKHDIQNGGGVAIAAQVVKQMKPVLKETEVSVAQTAASVAVALAEKQVAEWGGIERRNGPADRRG